MADAEADVAARLLAGFVAAGAERVDPGYLQDAEVLLDLYGETIRARAYTTHDPVHGEAMLRPDFTVPVVQMHMAERRQPARYAYAGPVWRRQEYGADRRREYWQAGYELFDGSDPAAADAEVFALISAALAPVATTPTTGDIRFLLAGIAALRTSDSRKLALRRHLWRPARFQRLLDRYSGAAPFQSDTRPLVEDAAAAVAAAGPAIGRRSAADVVARVEALKEERATPDLAAEEVAMLTAIAATRGASDACLAGFEALRRTCAVLAPAIAQMEARLEALAARGIAAGDLPFDASFGRDTMEYYDGFVFAFRADATGAQVATGGRYDALTRVLGHGRAVPAVGAVIRPADLADAIEAAP